MWYKLVLFSILFFVFSGCSSKSPDYYNWKSYNTIIHNRVLELKSDSSKVIKVREIKYYIMSKKNNKDGSTIYSAKNDRYIYLNPAQKLDMTNGTFQAKSKLYDNSILFYGNSTCEGSNYPCSFQSLRLLGEVFQKGKRNFSLSRALTLSDPLRMSSEESMRKKVSNFLSEKRHNL